MLRQQSEEALQILRNDFNVIRDTEIQVLRDQHENQCKFVLMSLMIFMIKKFEFLERIINEHYNTQLNKRHETIGEMNELQRTHEQAIQELRAQHKQILRLYVMNLIIFMSKRFEILQLDMKT